MKKLSLFLLSLLMIFLTSLNNIREVKSIEYNTKRYIVIKIILHIYGVLDYVSSCFDVLHTTGRDYIVEDIDIFIDARKNNN